MDFCDLGSEGVAAAASRAKAVAVDPRLDARAFRTALGGFVTGVTVVTTRYGGRPVGVTVNSFTSVSLDPALLLFCIGRNSSNAAAFACATHFAINILEAGQREIAATKGEARFGLVADVGAGRGPPVIADALAVFECERHAEHDGGDHLIYIGRVQRAWFQPARDPLVFFRGAYTRLDPNPDPREQGGGD